MNIQPRLLALAAVSVIGLSSCATTGYPSNGYAGSPPPYSSGGVCYDCGTVTRIEATGSTGAPRSGVTGAVIGGLVGAAAGHTIANDSSKGRQNVATVGGAAAGAAAGAAIERNMGGTTTYNVYVRMDDGRETVVSQSDLGGVREGTRVRVYNGRVWVR
ncbi:glycine zipper 2TM domain-containing protein [Cognatilysobacter lacus]|uniref:Glycine zipper 2TM domain-containing protein n=1 Tax=Cognatilysobacter lacus TaxID=1643323 RepID=A0A5D8ZBY9_9GAMM|nr:glycine zipper 2TM domain-containing protein [Lysobacter lacus]TZF90184.1 glycine zipper 2TM domain-containing protein [Lysobacter lacus]